MKVLIRLKAGSQRVTIHAKNAYIKNGCYCVYREDDTVRKFPLANLFDVEVQPEVMDARNTPALMNVKIHLHGTVEPIALQADSTSHDRDMFVARMPSNAIKLYPMANIAFIDEDYAAVPVRRPKEPSGPLECMAVGESRETTPAAYFKKIERLIKTIPESDTQVKGCTTEDILAICAKGSSLQWYPKTDARVYRMIGFCVGVLRHHNRPLSFDEFLVEGPNISESGRVEALWDTYKRLAAHTIAQVGVPEPEGTDLSGIYFASEVCKMMLSKLDRYPLEGHCFSLGLVQGLLTMGGALKDLTQEVSNTHHMIDCLCTEA
ncbi:hypothetical protein [Pseudomonas serbica]|uniref:hypothetical protein n=1 Tax=Pseudomonas serbica TaxID=2965074 RepID=UPI00237A25D2|nr:hypothetical protein [Pseudomonas serbica]